MTKTKTSRKRVRQYGVQLRLDGYGRWVWIKPNGDPTNKPIDAAAWSGPDSEQSALEAAKTLSLRNPGLTFRVSRI
jgi:hypothetical protein